MSKDNKKNTSRKNTEELKSKSLYIRGTLTDAMYGHKSFDKKCVDKYRFSIKALPEDMEKLVEEAEPYYENVEEKWLPKWLTDEDAREYLNLSSNFDIKMGIKEDDGSVKDLGNAIDYINENGNINGSKVVLMVTLKEGAIYPQALLIKELRQTTISDMFMEFADELPF